MNLEEFVKTALVQIGSGVRSANELSERNKIGVVHANTANALFLPFSIRNSTIEFDVALTVSDSSTKEAKAGIEGGILQVVKGNVGANLENVERKEATSRVQFTVAINNLKED